MEGKTGSGIRRHRSLISLSAWDMRLSQTVSRRIVCESAGGASLSASVRGIPGQYRTACDPFWRAARPLDSGMSANRQKPNPNLLSIMVECVT